MLAHAPFISGEWKWNQVKQSSRIIEEGKFAIEVNPQIGPFNVFLFSSSTISEIAGCDKTRETQTQFHQFHEAPQHLSFYGFFSRGCDVAETKPVY